MNVVHEDPGRHGWLRPWLRRRRVLLAILAGIALLPMLLAPTHPIAVYGYLASRYLPDLVPEVWARTQPGLAEFLLSPPQLARYREELVEDLLDTRGGRLFAIVRMPDGSLAQEPIRTWNALLPPSMPVSVNQRLDRKEFPFLGDAVALWLEDKTIVAMGHYHPFGGGPSPGDIRAQQFSSLPEVVVSNGMVPVVYLRGVLVPYGTDVPVNEDLYRSLRTLEWSLHLDHRASPDIPPAPTPALVSFLAYLQDYMKIDLDDMDGVQNAIGTLCEDLAMRCAPAFTRGQEQRAYRDNPDVEHLVRCIQNVRLWVSSMGYGRVAMRREFRLVADGATAYPARVLILSGQNNHAWQETTPVLRMILEESGCAVAVTEHPETMTVASIAGYDVILSNWNAWGDAAVQSWPEAARLALMAFVRSGHGFVSVHAGSSSFYDWDEYQALAITAWDLKTTGHGKRHAFKVSTTDVQHPITRGVASFEIFDELWHGVPVQPEAQVLATAFSSTEFGGSGRDEPILFSRSFGKGRSVNLLLGHDVQAMGAPGFATLLRRSVTWAARGGTPASEAADVPGSDTVLRPGAGQQPGAVARVYPHGAVGLGAYSGRWWLACAPLAGRSSFEETTMARVER